MNIHQNKTNKLFSDLFVFILFISIIALDTVYAKNLTEIDRSFRDSIAAEMQQVLDNEFEAWYPRSVDTLYGGFLSDFDYQWKLSGRQDKMIVTQARHIWSTANAAMFYQKDNMLRTISHHGMQLFENIMWDKKFGGFYDLVTREGEPVKEDGSIIKRAYGNAFVIYGLAAYFRASGDSSALKLAIETFRWLEKHSFDPEKGGYFQFMTREGIPFKDGFKISLPSREFNKGKEYQTIPPKDQNSSIHILECYAELYKVWPDPALKKQLLSLLYLIRDVIVKEKGNLTLYMDRELAPVSYMDSSAEKQKRNYMFDHVSFGHDVETAYLMLEASEVLGLKNDTTTLKTAKKMIDMALQNGWDKKNGGFFDGGYYYPGKEKAVIIQRTKEWWSQVEALNSFLMMYDLFPDDKNNYFEKFCIQWNYCKKYLIDWDNKGWYFGGTDIVPEMKQAPKASIWKGNYHTSRGLINCIQRLRRQTLTAGEKHFDPVNKKTILQAKQLLDYLYSIRGRHIIAGHHNYIGRVDTYPNRIKELTGKLPQIWGCDLGGYFSTGYMDTLVQTVHKKYKEGYIITLMWHVGRPQDDPPFGWKESVQARITDEEWAELITPGTKLNSRWLDRTDTIAMYLKKIESLGVPVIWRPYHELNGVWFWWGNRKGENGSAKLYKMMFDRFVKYHKLNNLIWVWNANAPRQLINDEAYAYKDFFPGLEYVDVLAADIYHNDYRQSHHDELAKLSNGKVTALAEVGEVPSPEILERQPLWTWFMIWGNFVDTHNTPQQIRDLYYYPKTLTHEDFIENK
ncbi:MAG: AGE family epimerase/isomerase [Bacteroidetes bacterium]|nr:AGE family epimerase/isomerase [Bacteroidota bacterium]